MEYLVGRKSDDVDPIRFFANLQGNLTGVVSERDYITKIALLGRTSKDTKVKQIATQSSKLVTAKPEDSVEQCMEKMLQSDIRHLPIVDSAGELKGMISIKDLVKTVVKEKEQTIKVLSDFALGKGGHFGSE
jgi:CBS domain-containing protein